MYDMQHDERLRPALVTRKDRTGVAHQRIRKFNTRDTYPEQKLSNDLAQAVVANNIVFLRGQVGQNLDTSESVGIGDVAAQTEQAMETPSGGARYGVSLTVCPVDELTSLSSVLPRRDGPAFNFGASTRRRSHE